MVLARIDAKGLGGAAVRPPSEITLQVAWKRRSSSLSRVTFRNRHRDGTGSHRQAAATSALKIIAGDSTYGRARQQHWPTAPRFPLLGAIVPRDSERSPPPLAQSGITAHTQYALGRGTCKRYNQNDAPWQILTHSTKRRNRSQRCAASSPHATLSTPPRRSP